MGFYGDLDTNLNEIKIRLYQSQKLAKLMTVQDDPLSPNTPDIQNIPSVLDGKIEDAYVLPTEDEVGCKLIILFTNIGSMGGTFKSCIVDINILVHKNWKKIKGKNRLYQIADTIDELLTNNFKLSMGGLKSIGGQGYFDVGNGNPFKGFNIRFKSVDFSR